MMMMMMMAMVMVIIGDAPSDRLQAGCNFNKIKLKSKHLYIIIFSQS